MNNSRFEFDRSGVPHRYEIGSDALIYTAGVTTAINVRWSELKHLTPGPKGEIYLVSEGHQDLAVWLFPKDMQPFLDALFAAWGRQNYEQSLKAAFAYGSDRRSIGWISLVITLLVPGYLTVMLLTDAFNTLHCNKMFERQAVLAPAQVTKVKKDSRGNTLWTIESKTTDGHELNGERSALVYDPDGKPTGPVMIAYAPDDTSCWDLSLKTTEPVIPHAQRHVSLLLTMSFGWASALVSALAILFSVRKLTRRFPYRDEVAAAGKKLEESRRA